MSARRLVLFVLAGLLVGCGEKRQTTHVPAAAKAPQRDPRAATVPPGEESAWPRFDEGPPVHDGAVVSLLLDKAEHFLGENILVHYCIENQGTEPFTINTGGDYRGAPRATRFRVVAFAEDGARVGDPYPHTTALAGLSGDSRLRPGARFYESLPLVRYCRFEKPGLYTVRVVHDLGWRETRDRVIPWGETRLRLVMPTEEQARRVVEEMYRLGQPRRRVGRRSEPYADFAALAYPVYLPVLLLRAKQGDDKALVGLGAIPTPEATKALIGLLAHDSPTFASRAASVLSRRLPAPPQRAEGGEAAPWLEQGSIAEAEREYLVPRAWRAEFAPAIRAQASELLARDDPDSVANGAALLQSLGEAEDLSALVAALDRLAGRIEPTPDRRDASDAARAEAERQWKVADALLDVLRTALQGGGDIPYPPRGAGEAVAFVWAVASREGFRPAGWEDHLAAALQHGQPLVRKTALASLPEPVPRALVGLIGARFTDDDLHVLLAACKAARRAKAPGLKDPALALLQRAKDPSLLGQALLTARALGGYVDGLEVLASRLDDGDVATECISHLSHLVEGALGTALHGPADDQEARALKARWLEFLKAHRDAIAAGRRFRIGDPELTPDLFPQALRFYRDGQPEWPER